MSPKARGEAINTLAHALLDDLWEVYLIATRTSQILLKKRFRVGDRVRFRPFIRFLPSLAGPWTPRTIRLQARFERVWRGQLQDTKLEAELKEHCAGTYGRVFEVMGIQEQCLRLRDVVTDSEYDMNPQHLERIDE